MSKLSGPKILLEGPSGTGKTFAIGTIVDWAASQNPPKNVYVLFTENGLETLLGYWRDKGKPLPTNLFYHVCLTKPLGIKSLLDSATKIGMLSYESLTKLVDPNRAENNAFKKILESCANFTDDRVGTEFGPIENFTHDDIFVIDSLSELANSVMKMQIGNKPTASPPDYGVAQNILMNFLRLCTQGLSCTVVITAHVDRLVDEVSGTVKLMTKSIGRALAGDIPQLFSDVIYTVREGGNWYWDTAAIGVDVKTRSLPIASKQLPNFAVVMEKWKARGANED